MFESVYLGVFPKLTICHFAIPFPIVPLSHSRLHSLVTSLEEEEEEGVKKWSVVFKGNQHVFCLVSVFTWRSV